jgi:hypothetical protein
MLSPNDIAEAGYYWYLDAIGSAPQVVEVAGDDSFRVRFAGRQDELTLSDLQGSLVGPLRPPGAQQVLSEAEHKAVQAALCRTAGRASAPAREPGEGHPS